MYETHLNLGNLRGDFGDEAGAQEAFGRAVQLAPQSAEAHYGFAVAQSAHEVAMHHFNRALALKPEYPEAELARLYTQLKACYWNGLSSRIARVSEMAQDQSMPAL
ncbi:MAG: hypothetical protein EXR36_01885 [Betaproteobacteria bacterium]|nr:hypothetical protein [Betaproteobacteria bacterium]